MKFLFIIYTCELNANTSNTLRIVSSNKTYIFNMKILCGDMRTHPQYNMDYLHLILSLFRTRFEQKITCAIFNIYTNVYVLFGKVYATNNEMTLRLILVEGNWKSVLVRIQDFYSVIDLNCSKHVLYLILMIYYYHYYCIVVGE